MITDMQNSNIVIDVGENSSLGENSHMLCPHNIWLWGHLSVVALNIENNENGKKSEL